MKRDFTYLAAVAASGIVCASMVTGCKRTSTPTAPARISGAQIPPSVRAEMHWDGSKLSFADRQAILNARRKRK